MFNSKFLFVLLIQTMVYAQNFRVEHYDTDDGLPSTEFYDVFIDDKSYVWFASDKGIVRYNSNEFELFSLNNGLSNMVNFSFYKESKNRFWINGIDGSFTYWDGETFTPFAFNNKLIGFNKLENQWNEIIDIDSTNIYFIKGNAPKTEIYQINRESGVISINYNKKLECSENCSYKTKRHVNYINRYRLGNYEDLDVLKNDYSYATGKSLLINKNPKSTFIYNEFIINNKDLFIMSDEGLFKYDTNDFSKDRVEIINNASITSAILTPYGEIWATSISKGIFRIPSINVHNINLRGDENNIEGLFAKDNFIYAKSIFGNVFAINQNYEVHDLSIQGKRGFYKGYLDPNNNNIFYFGGIKYINGIPQLKLETKYNIVPLDSTNYLEYDYSHFKFINIQKKEKKVLLEVNKRILCLEKFEDTIYIGNYNGVFGINSYSKKSKKISLDIQKTEKGLRINDLESSKNILWAGSLGKGLIYKINTEWKFFDNELLSDMSINSLFAQNDSILWVGTTNGLNKIKYDIINSEVKVKSINYYNTSKGIISNYIKDITFFNNHIFLATDKGISYFKPKEIKTPKPILVIDKFQANSKEFKISDSVIELNHNENDVKIKYTGISHFKPLGNDNFYKYSLVNVEDLKNNNQRWIETNNRELEYLNLKPGDYIFKVQCSNSENLFSEIKSISFKIKPHFTQTFAFRLVSIILVLLSITGIWHYRTNTIKKQLSLNLRVKNAELKTLRNQMNPHFIFNSINAIQNYIFSDEKMEANAYVNSLSKLIRKSLMYSKKEFISLSEEIQFIKDYLTLEKMRFKDKFIFEIDYDETLLKDDKIIIPSLLSQPLIENAVKHAFKNIKYVGEIKVIYKKNNNHIEIDIIDNGKGFVQKKKSDHSEYESLGISIVQQRINLLNEKYIYSQAELIINSSSKGTHVLLKLPIIKS